MSDRDDLRERIVANLAPEDFDHADGDPAYLAEIVCERTGDDPAAVAVEIRAMFPVEAQGPPRAANARPEHQARRAG